LDIIGKAAVVTGGGSGIGRGICRALAQAGADVVVADIDFSRAQEVAADLAKTGRRAVAFASDVSSEASIESLADFAWAEMGRVDMVFNNAGVVSVGLAVDAAAKDLHWTYSVNVFGAWHGSVIFARRFLAQGGPAWICNTGSENSIGVASIGTGIYTSSKHAVLGMTDMLRHELAGKIGVSIVCPGIVKTDIWNAGRTRPAEFGGAFSGDRLSERATGFGLDPDAVGRHIVECVHREEFYIFTHRHVREVAEQRFAEIAAAMDRQWPEGGGDQPLSTVEIQTRVMAEAAATGN
jgi:NAD(P)-dependent dehydrogenase (short-subunit alcohol dehydrogenase family)